MGHIVIIYHRLVTRPIITKDCPVQQLSTIRLIRISRVNIHTLDKQIIVVTDSLCFLLVAREILSAVALQFDLPH